MKLLESVLKTKPHDFVVIKAYGAGRRLFAAIEAFAHPTEKVVTCVVSIDLDSLAVELVHEAAISVVDYVYADGWHGLLLRDAVLELFGGTTKLTKAALGKDGTLTALARQGDTTLVCGTKQLGNYAIEGFVAKVAGGKLVTLVESSKLGDPGSLQAIHATATQICAGGGIVTRGTALVVRGDGRRFETVSGGGDEIYAVRMKCDGSIMVGARDSATLAGKKTPTALSGLIGRCYGVTEFRGDEYWMSHDQMDFLFLFKRTGAKLIRKYRTKFHYVSYRSVPDGRMTASDDLLVVTNKNRIHLYDGKRWSQLAFQPDVKQLVKSLPAAMKR